MDLTVSSIPIILHGFIGNLAWEILNEVKEKP
jgi:hypothetical protein